MSDERYADYRLIQNGIMVAGAYGLKDDALREINHYAFVYSQDGPVKIERLEGKRWVEDQANANT